MPKKQPKIWALAPATPKQPSEAEKLKIIAACKTFITTVLKPRFLRGSGQLNGIIPSSLGYDAWRRRLLQRKAWMAVSITRSSRVTAMTGWADGSSAMMVRITRLIFTALRPSGVISDTTNPRLGRGSSRAHARISRL
jgi:hypothetical protein